MLNERVYEEEQFAAEPASTVTVSEELLSTAANDAARVEPISVSNPVRRGRRQALFTASPIGGWKVRMW